MNQYLIERMEDCSTSITFSFAIRCEQCNSYWHSMETPFTKAAQAVRYQHKSMLYEALYEREKNRAFYAAVKEAKEHFSQCPICKRVVCDCCFMICKELDMCVACANKLQEPGEPVNR